MRREMEERLDIHAVDIYGLSEVIGPGVASECVETKDGLHVWEDHFYPEVIDPVTGEVLPDGEQGELVFTSLTKQAMPVIRYRTRDLTRLLPGHRAHDAPDREDHRPHRRHDHPARREPVPDPDRGAASSARPQLSPHFQCVLSRAGTLDELTVAVERRDGRVRSTTAAEAGARARSGWSRTPIGVASTSTSSTRTPSSGRSARCSGSWTSGRRADSTPPGGAPEPDTDADQRAAEADRFCEPVIWSCTARPPSRSEASAPPEARNQRRVSRPRSAACTSNPPIRASR